MFVFVFAKPDQGGKYCIKHSVFVVVFVLVFVYLLSPTRVERASGEEMIASIFIHGGNDCKAAAINTN